ncbi:hypothetical protein [Mumia sp. DW29H23]|uniref:hypothetical protein n=1 Tax=Mumia sp. DW29H23 TaxID=3421241 RepID=UPI003D691355
MRRTSLLALTVAGLVLPLSACSGGGGEQPAAAEGTPSATPSATQAASGTRPAAEDLLSFRCVPTADPTVWVAQGVIVNQAGTADYRVTVLVASPGSTQATARRIVIPKVVTAVETPFTVNRLKVNPGSSPSCRVQLVRLG